MRTTRTYLQASSIYSSKMIQGHITNLNRVNQGGQNIYLTPKKDNEDSCSLRYGTEEL